MAEAIKVGIIGGGWPGAAHARGYQSAGGFKLAAVADLIPDRRRRLMSECDVAKEYASADDLLADQSIDAVSVCLPNDLHLPVTLAALKAGKHVMCESPPARDAKEARRMAAAAERERKVLMYAMQRRYGGNEQAARQAIAKGYAGEVYHVRAAWTRTRGVPAGTGWFTDRARSGGGAAIDLGLHMLDLGWHLLGEPRATSVMAVTHARFGAKGDADGAAGVEHAARVEDAAMALIRFQGGKSLELSCAWAINQPPQQQGAICRAYGDGGSVEVYTPAGATLYRKFTDAGEAEATPLKPPKTVQHAALMRHFRQCIQGEQTPDVGGPQGVALMEMMDAIYKSAGTGKSAGV